MLLQQEGSRVQWLGVLGGRHPLSEAQLLLWGVGTVTVLTLEGKILQGLENTHKAQHRARYIVGAQQMCFLQPNQTMGKRPK